MLRNSRRSNGGRRPSELRATAIAAAMVATMTGCDIGLFDARNCTEQLVPGIVLSVRDAAGGGPIASESVLAIARSSTYSDTAVLSGDLLSEPLDLVYDRPGTYEILVVADSYSPWQRSNVRVGLDESGCHVVTANITAELNRLTHLSATEF